MSLTISEKSSILDVQLGSESVFVSFPWTFYTLLGKELSQEKYLCV